MNTAQIIAEMLDQSRKFNLFYISKLDPDRVAERFEFNGKTMNSAFWIAGHLLWAETSMITNEGGPAPALPWINQFRIGSRDGALENVPDWPELLAVMQDWHQRSLAYINSQSDEDLLTPTHVAPARWDTIRKKAFYHCIRHESFHTGQLSWIAQAHGGQTP